MSQSQPNSEYFLRPEAITLLQGTDSLNVIDRVVSTKISNLNNLTCQEVLFCDFNGRINDFGKIYIISNKVLLISSTKEQEKTRRKLVDGKSWNEDCEILIADNAIMRISIFPRDSLEILSELDIDCSKLEDNLVFEIDDYLVSYSSKPYGETIDILVAPDKKNLITSLLNGLGYAEISPNKWEYGRIFRGVPNLADSHGNLPDEMGMGELVSKDKGCYPGQEVHARIESRGRTTKSICKLSGTVPIAIGKYRVPTIGSITVSSSSYSGDKSLALALIRIADNEFTTIQVDGNDFKVDVLNYR